MFYILFFHFTICSCTPKVGQSDKFSFSACLSLASEGFMCKTPAIADIVILVDGSWSIGRINFRLVRTFLENLVKAFTVEFDKTRIGEEFLMSGFLFYIHIFGGYIPLKCLILPHLDSSLLLANQPIFGGGYV